MRRHEVESPLPLGSSLLPELCCLEPSSLNRPHPPTRGHIAISPHGGLYAMSSLCGSAEATREWFRAFAAHSFLTCRPLRPRGVRVIVSSKFTMPTWSSPSSEWLDTPNTPTIRFTWAIYFAATLVHNCYGLSGCSPPRTDLTGINIQPREAFTSRLSTERSPLPSLDITTTSIGLLCRRDLHPLEWQLASLHHYPR